MGEANLLLVDDETRVLRSLKMLLKNQYQIHTAESGQQALQILQTHPIDVLVTDQRMPELSGVELLREAHKLYPDTMRILLTGYSDLNAIISSINEGEIYRFINKPWDPEHLRHTIAKAARIARSTASDRSAPKPVNVRDVSPTQARPKILVLDTDPDTAVLVRALTGSQAEVQDSRSLSEALKILANEDIAILVSELKLNDKDLSPALKALKRFNPATLALVVTAFKDSSSLIELINQAQIHRLLPKPLSRTLLERGLNHCLTHHRHLKQNPGLKERHTVEAMPNQDDTGLITGFVDKLRRRFRTA